MNAPQARSGRLADCGVDWTPAPLAVRGNGVFRPRHVWCVGRNYAEHAREMGADPDRREAVFFSKPAAALHQRDTVAWPPATDELHHEVELVAFLGAGPERGGRDLSPKEALACVFGFAVGCDLTRRDVQARAKAAGMPWALSKGFDDSAPVGCIVPAADWQPAAEKSIGLTVNDQTRQQARLGEMIRPVGELLARLSAEVSLRPGDVVFTGTPAGVGPLSRGDRVGGRIDGLPALEFRIEAR